MSRRAGKYAYVDGLCCVQGWNVSGANSAVRYAASCAPGGTIVSPGNEAWTGQATGVGYEPRWPEDEDSSFIGVVSADAGDIINEEGDVRFYQTQLSIPIAAGGPITWQADFAVQGELTRTTVTPYLDDCDDEPSSAKSGKVSIEATPDSGTFTDLEDVQSVTITLRKPTVQSVDSGLTYVDTGNLEGDLSFEINSDDIHSALYALNAVKRVRVYVDDTQFFEFDAIHFTGLSNFRVIRDPLTIIGFTVNGQWTARRVGNSTLGQVLLPGGAELYGEES